MSNVNKVVSHAIPKAMLDKSKQAIHEYGRGASHAEDVIAGVRKLAITAAKGMLANGITHAYFNVVPDPTKAQGFATITKLGKGFEAERDENAKCIKLAILSGMPEENQRLYLNDAEDQRESVKAQRKAVVDAVNTSFARLISLLFVLDREAKIAAMPAEKAEKVLAKEAATLKKAEKEAKHASTISRMVRFVAWAAKADNNPTPMQSKIADIIAKSLKEIEGAGYKAPSKK
jgi:enamine deaminase RidA (YjgF/YER057c/UK114 family)